MSQERCGNCKFFHPVPGAHDLCFGHPPIIYQSGVAARTHVKEKDFACSLFEALPEGQAPETKVKTQPDTPGDAAKQRRERR
jgi:hypothetical protein